MGDTETHLFFFHNRKLKIKFVLLSSIDDYSIELYRLSLK